MKTVLSLIVAFACTQLAAWAEPEFVEQSAVGQELKIPVHAWIDQSRQPEGIIVALHGLVFSGRNLDTIGRHLNAKGFDVYAQDMRGFGDWRKPHRFDGDSLIHFTQTKEDLTRILTSLRKKYPDTPIYCMGESLGANYALWESWTEPELMDGAILCGISYKVDVHPKWTWLLTFFQGISHPKRPIDLIPYVEPIISHDIEVAKTCMLSEHCTTRMKISDLIKAAITNRRAVQGVQFVPENMPVLIVAGKKDQIQKTRLIPEMVSKMGTRKTELVVLPDRGHLLLEVDSLDPDVTAAIDSWLDRQRILRGTSATAPKSVQPASQVEAAVHNN